MSMMNTYNITFYKLCQKSLPQWVPTHIHTLVYTGWREQREGEERKHSSLLDILYTFGLDLGSWIVFGGRLGCYVCSIHTQSCAWHTMSSKRSPPTVNESTPEASTAAAPTVDLHGVLVIRSQSEEKKSTRIMLDVDQDLLTVYHRRRSQRSQFCWLQMQ